MDFGAGCSRRCDVMCARGYIDAEKLLKLQAAYERFQKSHSGSLLRKHMTLELYDKLKLARCPYGTTLLECSKSGFENSDADIGIYAPEPEAYRVFSGIFNPIIEECHSGFKRSDNHPRPFWGDLESLGNVDPEGSFVTGIRVSVSRNLANYPFLPLLEKTQLREVQTSITKALKHLPPDFKGTYFLLRDLDKEEQRELREDNLLFADDDRLLNSAGAYQHWPSGRGIFYNESVNFLVWVNAEDHLQVISMDRGGDLGKVFRRLAEGLCHLTKQLQFARSERLGYLTLCPTNLGTTLRCTVQIGLCKLFLEEELFRCIAVQYQFSAKRISNKKIRDACFYRITNKKLLGVTEHQVAKSMHDGIKDVIEVETNLRKLADDEEAYKRYVREQIRLRKIVPEIKSKCVCRLNICKKKQENASSS